ncbi:metalloregulator ArsR/SmtB family transcription factor [Prosthecobacter sp.]|uniref:ArsR/SmtB family transcription factor n=1 Tax=Prosthecobacter sp. TaxID=1965333 RepID=UPI002486D8C9|nr:metalloregulator ArsR/SmtB family transcription factor [Prosthecobacter sp.]MDI1313573.1 metalloregulator ArsR/SmtB family transcription factor [Prosthecobacter sp.]
MARPKISPASLSPEALELIAARFKLLAEPMRLRLLQALYNGERNVTQLVEASGATQANVSKHLSLLCDAGVLRRRKDGLHVFYAIADSMVFDLCTLVCSRLQTDLERKVTHFQTKPAVRELKLRCR